MTDSERIAILEARIEALSTEVGILRDIHEVRTLHFKYGYYMDKCLFGEIVDLFTEDCEIYFLGGLFRGKAGARRLYGGSSGLNGPARGMMFEHLQVQDIVDVEPDRMSARGRFRCFLQGGVHDSKTDAPPNIPSQFWESGIYENTFARENGIWKIRIFNYTIVWQAAYETGWAHSKTEPMMVSAFTETWPKNPKGPDAIIDRQPRRWPENCVIPFHYAHPVTGKKWSPGT